MKRIFFFFLLCFTDTLFAIDPVILNDTTGEYPLGLYLEILEDKEGKLTIDDIQKPEMESLWVKSNSDVPGFGYSKSIYWVRFELASKLEKKYYLEIDYPHLDQIDFYSISSIGKITHKKTGDKLTFENRDINYRNFIFFIFVSESFSDRYYIRFESEGSILLPLNLWSPVTFLEKKNIEMIGFGFFFGALIVMAFYNLFLWASIRDRSHVYYVFYILANALATANVLGLTYQFLWIGSPELFNKVFSSLSIFLNSFISLVFTANFLQANKNLPRFHLVYKILAMVCILGFFLAPFMSYRFGSVTGILTIFFSYVWMLTAGVMVSLKGYRPAKFYLLSWSAFLFFSGFGLLYFLGIIPRNFVSTYSGMFGSVMQVILLSFGLADRINDLQKQNEVSQIRALEAEKKANKVKDEFLANLSHELRTPMTSVFVLSEMLASNRDYPEEVIEYSKEIRLGAGKLNDYVNDLILVTDIESNLELQKSNIELQSLVSDVIKEFSSLLEEKNIQLFFEKKDPIEMNCDPILLTKATGVIIKNAITYNKQDGEVHVFIRTRTLKTLDRTLHGIEIKVIDTGIGIAKEFQEKIFDKFFRVDSSLSYEVSGVGIGLFIAKKIIELHGGVIEVKSELGKGSEFTISLPLPQ